MLTIFSDQLVDGGKHPMRHEEEEDEEAELAKLQAEMAM